MIESQFIEINKELHKAATEKGHPFRSATLGTVGLGSIARLRTVIIRGYSENEGVTFFTDKRSKKVMHLKENPKASMLFYHPTKLLQLRIEGIANINNNHEELTKYWENMPKEAKKDYTTVEAPGTKVKNIDIEYLNESNNFCVITLIPYKIEYLKLSKPQHIKIQYTKDNAVWHSDYLVP